MTKQEADRLAADQMKALAARGASGIMLEAKRTPEGVWYVEGRFAVDCEHDPLWGPVVAALRAHGYRMPEKSSENV